ncbi:hypothetical protein ACFWYW_52705 [Nonomuraea sp. NPDC059023]
MAGTRHGPGGVGDADVQDEGRDVLDVRVVGGDVQGVRCRVICRP